MNKWIAELAELEEPSVLVTVASVRGSSPRDVGAKMLVTSKAAIGTIGGGQLEYQCTQIACEKLIVDTVAASTFVRRFALGANCGQCCGGVVEVLFEVLAASGSGWLAPVKEQHDERVAVVMATSTKSPFKKFLLTKDGSVLFGDIGDCPDAVLSAGQAMLDGIVDAQSTGDYLLEAIRPVSFNIAVFGAGHVGAATVDVLRRLECKIRWIDSRRNIFPVSLPENVLAIESTDPAREVLGMPAGSWFLVMTHSHPLDQEICARVLRREDFAYCGLIGSLSKRRRFERLLKKQGIPPSLVDRLVCPIGVDGIRGKEPAEIAIAVAAEVLQVRDALRGEVAAIDSNEYSIRAI